MNSIETAVVIDGYCPRCNSPYGHETLRSSGEAVNEFSGCTCWIDEAYPNKYDHDTSYLTDYNDKQSRSIS